jgi:PadR family transcriptional regulator, regulatory protein PadR
MTLQEPTFFTMVALLDGPLHGYAIIRRCEVLSGGRVTLNAGTLYTALDRLLAAEMVEVVREEIVSGRARRVYALTGSGRHLISQEGRRHAEAARLVTKRPGLRRIRGLA